MPIFVKKELYDPTRKAQEEQQAAAERPIIMETPAPVVRQVQVITEPVVDQRIEETPATDNTKIEHHSVVIGGKEKKIAKNSAYLIDMITL